MQTAHVVLVKVVYAILLVWIFLCLFLSATLGKETIEKWIPLVTPGH